MIFYVYEDWTAEIIPRCFYVGKGNKYRTQNLLRNQKHKNVSYKYGLVRRVIFQSFSEVETHIIEIKRIAELRTFAFSNDAIDIACNFTRGGEGSVGYEHSTIARSKIAIKSRNRVVSQLTRNKMSLSRKGNKNSFFGKQHAEEFRKRQSQNRKNKNRSLESRQKQSKTMIGHTSSITRNQKISNSLLNNQCGRDNKGKVRTQETKDRIRQSLNERIWIMKCLGIL